MHLPHCWISHVAVHSYVDRILILTFKNATPNNIGHHLMNKDAEFFLVSSITAKALLYEYILHIYILNIFFVKFHLTVFLKNMRQNITLTLDKIWIFSQFLWLSYSLI